MSYSLGVDLGTSYTAAATARDGRVEIANLGNQSATIPSVVLLKEDHTILTGDAASRRGVTEPDRVAREFKRRVGDTTPIFLGGAPQSAEALMARLLRWVADEVAAREGGPADRLAVCHPANWGRYKQDLLAQAVRIADLGSAKFITEPEAAAIHYASNQRIDPGEIVAVYDLGGGTFDAAVLRRTAEGFDILGEPEGIERLGGIDFDAAVFAHVVRSLGGKLEELDEDDPNAVAAVARLRAECVEAKEALSRDTDVSIQVLLPNVQTDVRLTRAEFETMIRPSLSDSIASMRRAFASAGVDAADVSTVLLAGGSSRIPLVSQVVGAELGRPVAVDAHPKHAVALGAAIAAASSDLGAGAAGAGGAALAGAAVAGAAVAAAPTEELPVAAPTEELPVAAQPTAVQPVQAGPPAAAAAAGAGGGGGNRTKWIIGAVVALGALVAVGAFAALSGGDDEPEVAAVPVATDAAVTTEAATTTEAAATTTEAATTTTEAVADSTTVPPTSVVLDPPDQAEVAASVDAVAQSTFSVVAVGFTDARTAAITGAAFDDAARQLIVEAATVPGMDQVVDQMTVQAADEQCAETVRGSTNWVCLQSATWDGSLLRASYIGSPDEGAAPWSLASLHLHFFGDNIPVVGAGVPGPVSDGSGTWKVWDDPSTFEGTLAEVGSPDGPPAKLCARVATGGHTLDTLEGGTCWPITVIG